MPGHPWRNSPGYHPIKLLHSFLRANRKTRDVAEATDCLTEENGLPLMRFNQSNLKLGSKHGDREPRKAGSRTYVGNAKPTGRKL